MGRETTIVINKCTVTTIDGMLRGLPELKDMGRNDSAPFQACGESLNIQPLIQISNAGTILSYRIVLTGTQESPRIITNAEHTVVEADGVSLMGVLT
ncbi:hypothetical protein BLNAU_14352 [Blattamonas nauphoetae]|uniref:Uncharacterized protein n=1 Tax=Blattamonas nauphoetae TaxID=2049346 RepID=A0ABQ9XKB0_9EUKA|nr:hypothetical protein BLNAU_14352 [Blattamonas nauphoetae]